MKRKLTTLLLSALMVATAIPTTVMAANNSFQVDNGSECGVTATATVTDEDISELGYTVSLSIPVGIDLGRNGTTFEGSGKIYAYGILDANKELTVSIDEENESYGLVYYDVPADGDDYTNSHDAVNDVTITLSKESFTSAETLSNLYNVLASEDMTVYSELNVKITNFIPFAGKGDYYTCVPLVVSID